MARKQNKTSNYVRKGMLFVVANSTQDEPVQIAVDSPEWREWLKAATAKTRFYYDCGTFGLTVQAESRHNKSTAVYFYAHVRVDGQLRKEYIGEPDKVTGAKLMTIGQQLAAQFMADATTPDSVKDDTSYTQADASYTPVPTDALNPLDDQPKLEPAVDSTRSSAAEPVVGGTNQRSGIAFLRRSGAEAADYPKWLAKHGLLDRSAVLARLHLTDLELKVCEYLHLIQPIRMPAAVSEWWGYPADVALTDDQHARLRAEIPQLARQVAEAMDHLSDDH